MKTAKSARYSTKERGLALLLALLLTAAMAVMAGCGERGEQEPGDIQAELAAYLLEQVPEPTVNSVGGEWTVIGLVRGNAKVPEDYYDRYYDNVRAAVKSSRGVLDERLYTEYARVSMALSAIGKDPSDVEGYDLLKPLDDYEAVMKQGINGAIYALIASNTCGYPLKNEDRYLKVILDSELESGGFSFAGEETADPDVTGMALQALSVYKDKEEAKQAAERAIQALSAMQKEDGGFGENSESVCQAIMGLSAAGVNVETDERFIKGENSLLDGLLQFRSGEGFSHEAGGEADLMSTEQALCVLDERM